ncbi:MAG: radical SAM protein [Actinomycetales bacterium]
MSTSPVSPPSGPSDLQVHPSRWCQLQCRHCYTSSGPDQRDALPADVLEQAVREAAGLGFGTLSISGGEPLLYPGLAALLAAGQRAGLRTAFTTNALGLSARRVAELAPVTDLVAVSVDGRPGSHDLMRGRRGAFDVMRSRLAHLRSAGVRFGFITTLTQHNVHELDWLIDFAVAEGAAQLQVHPLDGQGRALDELPGARPDVVELAVALLAAAATAPPQLRVLVDVTRRDELAAHPASYGAAVATGDPPAQLGSWLPSLVVEPDGWLSPLTYGLHRRWGLGSLRDSGLAELAARWVDTTAPVLVEAVADARARVLASGTPLLLWTEALRHLLEPEVVSAAT